MKMLFTLGLLITLAAPPLLAQSTAAPAAPSAQVGVDEKLGAQVPMDLVLNDEDGKPVSLGSLIDRPTVLTLNYFRCAGICTPLLNGLADVINQIQDKPGQDFQVITVSFDATDTARDGQDEAAQLPQGDHPALPAHLLALPHRPGPGHQGPVRRRRLQVPGPGRRLHPFRRRHGPLAQGKVTRYMYGTTFQPADLQMAVLEAARGETRPTVNHLLAFCFSQSPSGRGYVFDVTKAVAILTFLMIGGFLAWLFLHKKRSVHS